jgi:hypothetical protein
MKKIIISVIVALIIMISFAQAQNENTSAQTINAVVYRLFPTKNMWIFVKLNTRNGVMWQVQYDINGNNRFETNLNSVALATSDKEVNDRFTLYPTQNMYNFILLDQLDGRMWQVQWSTEATNRGIIPIE